MCFCQKDSRNNYGHPKVAVGFAARQAGTAVSSCYADDLTLASVVVNRYKNNIRR